MGIREAKAAWLEAQFAILSWMESIGPAECDRLSKDARLVTEGLKDCPLDVVINEAYRQLRNIGMRRGQAVLTVRSLVLNAKAETPKGAP